MKLNIGISPCPNDTFIFDAIYNRKMDTSPYEFEFIFEDVQTLNEMAMKGHLDIVKLSYAHYFSVMPQYIMMRSGSALGYGTGPLLIGRNLLSDQEIEAGPIAIPGKYTTAGFLLAYAYPGALHTTEMVFSQIEQCVLNGQAQAGVIIHENRFTYAEKGLMKIADLGEIWESRTGLPIPLGGIAIRRNLPAMVHQYLNSMISQSVLIANAKYPELSSFIQSHAREMSEEVMRQHIHLYVNENSIDITSSGLLAVEKMKEMIAPFSTLPLFIPHSDDRN
ncbi:MAG: 1,4-dihydroxy-6-naphthoate synthase [Chitinophagaceae bacterium]|nr:1,4-dihydroxy-6-naphthoate synthase [Chitinophagaceae bacterium]